MRAEQGAAHTWIFEGFTTMMDSFEFNKIAGALLFTVLIVLGLNTLSDVLFHAEQPEKPGYAVEVADSSGGAVAPVAAADGASFVKLLANADPDKGAKQFKKCAACHTIEEGGSHKIGPNLHNIIGRTRGSAEGFAYSKAMTEKGGAWTYEEMNAFLTKPKAFLPGTKMAFAGVKKEAPRADLILYLKSISPGAPGLPAE
jgi:cytochrome c